MTTQQRRPKPLRHIPLFVVAVFAIVLFAGCSDSGEECPELGGDPVITSVIVNPTTMAAGDTVEMTVDGEHLGELEEVSMDTGMEEEGEEESHCPGGHFHVYLDDLETNPITMQEAKTFPLVIPEGTTAGAHTLIVRLHNKDHIIYEPQVTKDVSITVE